MFVNTAVWRGIEVVITRRSWKPFVRKGAWVRIPPSPLYTDSPGEIPKRLKGLHWKGSRSLIAARGFKSLFLRFRLTDVDKKVKKVVDKNWQMWYYVQAVAEDSRQENLDNWTIDNSPESSLREFLRTASERMHSKLGISESWFWGMDGKVRKNRTGLF